MEKTMNNTVESYTRSIQTFNKLVTHISEEIQKLPNSKIKDDASKNLAKFNMVVMTISVQNMENPNFRPLKFRSGGVEADVQQLDPKGVTLTKRSFQNNNSTNEQSFEFKDIVEFDEEITFGFKEGIKIGASAKVGFDIGVANAEVSISAEFNFEASQTVSNSKRLTHSVNVNVDVPPCSVTEAEIDITRAPFSGTYTLHLIPEATSEVLDHEFYKETFGSKNIEQIFPKEINLTMVQKGTIDGVTGVNLDTKVGNPTKLVGGCGS
ncbi:MAG: ETX/MTX2 family pore-forming toxin [Saprospiraceae bacterium]